jgi:isopenicillin-N N-acyltransferase like protein
MTITEVYSTGSHRALGRAQGEATGEAIRSALDFYEPLARRRATSIANLAASLGDYIDPARLALPHLVEEMEGMAEGAQVDAEAIFFLNALEEVWPAEACTTMTHGPLLLHAEQWYAGHTPAALVCCRPNRAADGPALLSPTCPGCLPAVGMNAAGLAQGIDSLTDPGDRTGIPRVLVSRHALGQPSPSAARRAATIEGRAGGYAHTLATAAGALVVETTATHDWTLADSSAHTNHYLAGGLEAAGSSRGSRARLERARALLAAAPPRSLEDGARLLADHDSAPQSICLHEEGPEASATIFGMICDLSSGRMLVSDGPPCEGRWLEAEVPGFRAARGTTLVG